jgi:hypothetical protein
MLFDAALWYLDRFACSRMWLILRHANNEYLPYIYAICGFLSMTSAKNSKGEKSHSILKIMHWLTSFDQETLPHFG